MTVTTGGTATITAYDPRAGDTDTEITTKIITSIITIITIMIMTIITATIRTMTMIDHDHHAILGWVY